MQRTQHILSHPSPKRRILFTIVSIISTAVMLFTSMVAYAQLTPQQRSDYAALGIDYIDGQCTVGTNDVSVTGSINGSPTASSLHSKFGQHVIDAFFAFLKAGFSPAQSAGIVGNLMVESYTDIEPTASDGTAYGIAQWQGSRLQPMIDWVTANYHDKTSFPGQLAYIVYDLQNDHSSVGNGLKGTGSSAQAAQYWNLHYEISADTSTDRTDNARNVFDAATEAPPAGEGWIAAAGGTVTTSSSQCSSSSNEPANCVGVAGNAQIYCDAIQYDPVSYLEAVSAGHQGGAAWHATCPTIGPSCYLDCSGLVNIAVWDVFKVDLKENTNSERADTTHWKRISFDALQTGDLIQPNPGHVEIVNYVSGDTVYTFAAHTDSVPQAQQVGPTTYSLSGLKAAETPSDPTNGSAALRWTNAN